MTQLSLKAPVFFLKDSVLVVELRCGFQAGTVEMRGGSVPTGCAAEPVFQLLPEAVIDADGLLQALAQVPDLPKMFF